MGGENLRYRIVKTDQAMILVDTSVIVAWLDPGFNPGTAWYCSTHPD
jgi:hypothetical protein